jgi:hypothetical protein
MLAVGLTRSHNGETHGPSRGPIYALSPPEWGEGCIDILHCSRSRRPVSARIGSWDDILIRVQGFARIRSMPSWKEWYQPCQIAKSRSTYNLLINGCLRIVISLRLRDAAKRPGQRQQNRQRPCVHYFLAVHEACREWPRDCRMIPRWRQNPLRRWRTKHSPPPQ